jgi:uncharacterized protein YciI
MKYFPLATLFLFISITALAQKKNMDTNSLKPYYLVLLKKGDNRTQDTIQAADIQKQHLRRINEMAASGKLNVAGPVLDEGDLRGIFIFDCETQEEVVALCEADPAVRAGRLTYEIYAWMTQKGTCFK